MINRFTINNVTYTAKPFDFGLVCDLDSYGVGLQDFSKHRMALIRAYFALSADLDLEDAAKEIQEHIVNGGNLDSLSDAMAKEMNDSDFFRALSNRNEQEAGEDSTEDTTEKPKRGRKPNEK